MLNYILREETKKEEIRIKALRRTIKFEEEGLSKKKLIKECIRELEKERRHSTRNGGEEGRGTAKRKFGIEKGEMEKVRDLEEGKVEKIMARIREKIEETEKGERKRRLEDSKYNVEYKGIITQERPNYLKGRMNKGERSLITRFRCGNAVKGNRHWRRSEDRLCRICMKEE